MSRKIEGLEKKKLYTIKIEPKIYETIRKKYGGLAKFFKIMLLKTKGIK